MMASVNENQDATLRQFATMLHDLSQPMTTIRCLLDLAEMENEVEPIHREISDALRECERMVAMVNGMRETLVAQSVSPETLLHAVSNRPVASERAA